MIKIEWMVPKGLAAWFAGLLLSMFSAMVMADVQTGIAAYDRGDFVAALREFQEAAKSDDARALNYLGIMHAEGLGTLRDDYQAASMFDMAAILGYPEAMANLARMYAEGRGGRHGNKAAVSAYWAAAKAGFQPAISRMAKIYENGELGEAPDAVLAREWRARLQTEETRTGDSTRSKGSASVKNAIQAVAVTHRRGQILIRVSTNAPLARSLTSFTMANPPRIVLDFPNTVNGVGTSVQNIGEGNLRSIKLVQVDGRVRVVLTLRTAMQHVAKVHGRYLLITLSPGRRINK